VSIPFWSNIGFDVGENDLKNARKGGLRSSQTGDRPSGLIPCGAHLSPEQIARSYSRNAPSAPSTFSGRRSFASTAVRIHSLRRP